MKNHQKRKEQIYITRSHILAISITTLSIAILAYAIGLKTGKAASEKQTDTEELIQPPFLPDTNQQDTLEELLHQIQKAHQNEEGVENAYFFPDEFNDQPLPAPPEEETAPPEPTEVRPAVDPEPPKPKMAAIQPPTSGWAVQVSSYPSQKEAKQHISKLQTHGLMAYYVTAEIKGKTWYRVRVGGYTTAKKAEKGKEELEEILLETGFMIFKAP